MAERGAKSEGGNPSRDPRARFYGPDGLISRALRKRFPPSIKRACTEREVGIEKTAPSGMEEGICTRGSRRNVRVGQLNTGECTKGCGMGHMTAQFGQPITSSISTSLAMQDDTMHPWYKGPCVTHSKILFMHATKQDHISYWTNNKDNQIR